MASKMFAIFVVLPVFLRFVLTKNAAREDYNDQVFRKCCIKTGIATNDNGKRTYVCLLNMQCFKEHSLDFENLQPLLMSQGRLNPDCYWNFTDTTNPKMVCEIPFGFSEDSMKRQRMGDESLDAEEDCNSFEVTLEEDSQREKPCKKNSGMDKKFAQVILSNVEEKKERSPKFDSQQWIKNQMLKRLYTKASTKSKLENLLQGEIENTPLFHILFNKKLSADDKKRYRNL